MPIALNLSTLSIHLTNPCNCTTVDLTHSLHFGSALHFKCVLLYYTPLNPMGDPFMPFSSPLPSLVAKNHPHSINNELSLSLSYIILKPTQYGNQKP